MTTPYEQSSKRRVLVTGAAGRVARIVIPSLAERYILSLLDVPQADFANLDDYGTTYKGSVIEASEMFADIDAVVHLAANPSPSARFAELLEPNILACAAAFDHAVANNCGRVVLASSVHAVGGYMHDQAVRPEAAPWPVNLYGVTKAFGEAYAHYVGSTTSTSVVVLRIGAAVGAPPQEDTRSIVLHPAELIRYVIDAIEWPGAGTKIVNAVSVPERLHLSSVVRYSNG